MRWLNIILALGFGLLLSGGVLAAEHAAAEGAHGGGGHHSEGLPADAPRVLHLGPLEITNSTVMMFAMALLLILGAQLATRNLQLVPQGLQNFAEWLVESLYGFLEGIIGSDLVKKTFWFFATVFIVILATNWFGLIPGVGTVGWGVQEGGQFHVSRPLLRGANADLNTTLAISVVFFICWLVWALQSNGIGGFISHLFGVKGDSSGFMKLVMVLVFFAVGILEVVSIAFRPVSLSFRLYGNIFAGENMLETMAHLGGPYFGWLLPLPFYGMELLVGVVQALVFMLLTAVFTLLICTHDESHGHGHEHGPGEAH
ncbi:MAG: F0F1 ATP synthase subunit A [Verrucomicrobiae bacterium]|nr:F0F1 ATP synthase subunit A [Verrucomicrobiae bacterium]